MCTSFNLCMFTKDDSTTISTINNEDGRILNKEKC